MARLTVQPTLRQTIIDSQQENLSLHKTMSQLGEGRVDGFSKSSDDELMCPSNREVKERDIDGG